MNQLMSSKRERHSSIIDSTSSRSVSLASPLRVTRDRPGRTEQLGPALDYFSLSQLLGTQVIDEQHEVIMIRHHRIANIDGENRRKQ
jgi:hypothetical protein